MVETDPHLTMFFYGTLKRGHANHDQFCRGYLSAEEARTRGRLYHLPFGYPALVIDEEDIRAVGTADPTSEASEQRSLGLTGARLLDGPRVSGELFAFGDPEVRLPVLDRLEGFDPARGPSLYRRVLIPVETSGGVALLAWAYVVDSASGVYLPGGRWPP
jgi:gamma-glutamylcyclotransferase (GGCT)/AIG2-like uncharacterized protein YtfP